VNELRWETRLLAVVAATLVVFGIAMTYGASSLVRTKDGGVAGGAFALTQLTGALLGGVLMVTMARIDYRRLRPLAWPLLLVTIFFLFIPILPFTRSISPVINGARRWVQLGPINFQPSELARLAVILWCAMLAAKKESRCGSSRRVSCPSSSVLGFVSLLIVLQPNSSMATLIALLGGIVLFTAGAKIGHFLVLGFVAVLLVFQKIHDAQYRLARFTAFMSSGDAPDAATSQIHQSFVGIGSGGLFGVGFGQGQQGFGYLPYAYSDFIFSSIGEEWGFIGSR
jgi:cell division protein FtsW